MDKEDIGILKYLVEKELKTFKEEEDTVIFPTLDFLKSTEMYEEKLKKLAEKLKKEQKE